MYGGIRNRRDFWWVFQNPRASRVCILLVYIIQSSQEEEAGKGYVGAHDLSSTVHATRMDPGPFPHIRRMLLERLGPGITLETPSRIRYIPHIQSIHLCHLSELVKVHRDTCQ